MNKSCKYVIYNDLYKSYEVTRMSLCKVLIIKELISQSIPDKGVRSSRYLG